MSVVLHGAWQRARVQGQQAASCRNLSIAASTAPFMHVVSTKHTAAIVDSQFICWMRLACRRWGHLRLMVKLTTSLAGSTAPQQQAPPPKPLPRLAPKPPPEPKSWMAVLKERREGLEGASLQHRSAALIQVRVLSIIDGQQVSCSIMSILVHSKHLYVSLVSHDCHLLLSK